MSRFARLNPTINCLKSNITAKDERKRRLEYYYKKRLQMLIIRYLHDPPYRQVIQTSGKYRFVQLFNESLDELWDITILDVNSSGGLKKDSQLLPFLFATLMNLLTKKCAMELGDQKFMDWANEDRLLKLAKRKERPAYGRWCILIVLLFWVIYFRSIIICNCVALFTWMALDLNHDFSSVDRWMRKHSANIEDSELSHLENPDHTSTPTAVKKEVSFIPDTLELNKWYGGGIYIDNYMTMNPMIESVLKSDTLLTMFRIIEDSGTYKKTQVKLRLFADPKKHGGVNLSVEN